MTSLKQEAVFTITAHMLKYRSYKKCHKCHGSFVEGDKVKRTGGGHSGVNWYHERCYKEY